MERNEGEVVRRRIERKEGEVVREESKEENK